MRRWAGSAWLFGLATLTGCEPYGVSVGTEALCIKDPRLAVAEGAGVVTVSRCAEIGENQLLNAGFEQPIVSTACRDTGQFCQFPVAEVGGWLSNSPEQVIEIWLQGHMDVPSPDGAQFGELDARSRDTLYQDVALPAGQLMYWSLVHRGRTGIDSAEVWVGSPEAPALQRTISSPEDAWYPYSGFYQVGDEPLTRFALVSRNGEEEGNLVDAVVFAPVN